MTTSSTTIAEILKAGADSAPALSSPGGTPLSYASLRRQVAEIGAALAAQGIGQNDRVGIVLDNGPEMAAAFLCVGSAATAAPLNPTYRAEEFEFYLTDLRAKLLIVGKDKESPSIRVAERLGVPIARLVPHPERGAGSFDLEFAQSGGGGGSAASAARVASTTSRSCCTRRARRRAPRSFHWRTGTSAHRRPTSGARCS